MTVPQTQRKGVTITLYHYQLDDWNHAYPSIERLEASNFTPNDKGDIYEAQVNTAWDVTSIDSFTKEVNALADEFGAAFSIDTRMDTRGFLGEYSDFVPFPETTTEQKDSLAALLTQWLATNSKAPISVFVSSIKLIRLDENGTEVYRTRVTQN